MITLGGPRVPRFSATGLWVKVRRSNNQHNKSLSKPELVMVEDAKGYRETDPNQPMSYGAAVIGEDDTDIEFEICAGGYMGFVARLNTEDLDGQNRKDVVRQDGALRVDAKGDPTDQYWHTVVLAAFSDAVEGSERSTIRLYSKESFQALVPDTLWVSAHRMRVSVSSIIAYRAKNYQGHGPRDFRPNLPKPPYAFKVPPDPPNEPRLKKAAISASDDRFEVGGGAAAPGSGIGRGYAGKDYWITGEEPTRIDFTLRLFVTAPGKLAEMTRNVAKRGGMEDL